MRRTCHEILHWRSLWFTNNTTLRMTTTKSYDYLNRLTAIWVITCLIAVGLVASGFLYQATSNQRSWLGREVRLWKGEHMPEQFINDLAKDFARLPEFKQIQPWATNVLQRCRTGMVRTTEYANFFWTDSVQLTVEEVPTFLGPEWVKTNRSAGGWVLPEVSIALNNGLPECAILDWGSYGIAAGAPSFELFFSPDISTNVSPGIYIFGYRK